MTVKNIAKNLRISDRVECLARTSAVITFKCHKDNFQSRLPFHQLNPSYNELGKINKLILENINERLVNLLNTLTNKKI